MIDNFKFSRIFHKKDRIVNCLLTEEEADSFCAFIRRHEVCTLEVDVQYPDEAKVYVSSYKLR